MATELQKAAVYFDDLVHGYITKDGRILSGVTPILKEMGLAPDYKGISAEVLEAAARRGSMVHHDIDLYNKGVAVVDSPLIQSWKTALAIICKGVIASEYLVADEGRGIASSIDTVLDDYSLVDIKTTSQVHYKAVRWQLSIYKMLFEGQNPECVVPHLYVAHIRNGKCCVVEVEPVPVTDICEMLDAWSAHLPYTEPIPPTILKAEDQRQLLKVEQGLAALDEMMDELKAQREAIIAAYGEDIARLGEVDCGDYVIKFKRPYERTTIDTKALKKGYPEIYDKFSKTSQVAGSYSVKIKTTNDYED